MEKPHSFLKTVCQLAVPVTLQSILQSSFNIVDQIMIGQLGSVCVAGVGLAGKFASIQSVILSAIGAVAGIMISQYLGQKNKAQVRRNFSTNLLLAACIAGLFSLVCVLFSEQIIGLYTKDPETCQAASSYLLILTGTFLPLAGATLLSTLLRCLEKPRLPLYASLFSAGLNTVVNYLLIFGKWGFAPMGVQGAAIATVLSQWANFLLMLLMLPKQDILPNSSECSPAPRMNWKEYFSILGPILVCEVFWSLGENIYAAIYGHMGTDASAAMTLINPIQGLMIGALCGLSQAASILVGKQLGSGAYDGAYRISKQLIVCAAVGSAILSLVILGTRGLYVQIYQVEEHVRLLTRQILLAYALVAPFKVLNMVLGGGILRSGGQTRYVMYIDLIGTWIFGVPLGLAAAFCFKLSIPWVYFLLSLEECVRFLISLFVFRRKGWMHQLQAK